METNRRETMRESIPSKEGIRVFQFMCKVLVLVLIIAIMIIAAKSGEITKLHQLVNKLLNEELPSECSNKIFCGVNESTVLPSKQVNEHCYPNFIKEYKLVFIINVGLIMLIGGLGNFLTLAAVPYCFMRYPGQFDLKWNSRTFLIVHLSFCDLAYILVGLTAVLNIYINDGFTYDPSFCWFSATFRNLICYADFITLACMALITMIGFLKGTRQYSCFTRPSSSIIYSIIIWAMSFFLISFIVFEAKFPNLEFGKYSLNTLLANCNTIRCSKAGINGPAVIYTIGFFVPFFMVMISYMIVTPICIMKHTASYRKEIEENREMYVDVCAVNKTLFLLTMAYTIFSAPVVAIEWLDSSTEDHHTKAMRHIIGYNWYWWIYAINFIVYMCSFEEFRKMYKIFLTDALSIMCMTTSDVSHLVLKPRRHPATHHTSMDNQQSYEISIVEQRIFNMESVSGNDDKVKFWRSASTPGQQPSPVLVRSKSAPPFKRRRKSAGVGNPRELETQQKQSIEEPAAMPQSMGMAHAAVGLRRRGGGRGRAKLITRSNVSTPVQGESANKPNLRHAAMINLAFEPETE